MSLKSRAQVAGLVGKHTHTHTAPRLLHWNFHLSQISPVIRAFLSLPVGDYHGICVVKRDNSLSRESAVRVCVCQDNEEEANCMESIVCHMHTCFYNMPCKGIPPFATTSGANASQCCTNDSIRTRHRIDSTAAVFSTVSAKSHFGANNYIQHCCFFR